MSQSDLEGRWPALFLFGPTASGKTELALALAEQLPVALISVDSAQVYRGLDIGSAKPSREVLARHPHALIDIRDPADAYSAAAFRDDALAAMAAARASGKVPLLVGGTMLYFNVLEQGIAEVPAATPEVRSELLQRLAEEGSQALHGELMAVDPVAARGMHPNNRQRVVRALEVYRASGRPLSWWWARQQDLVPAWQRDFAPLRVALWPRDRAQAHARIAERFDVMLATGLIDEVAELRRRQDLDLDCPSMRAVGYRQVWQYLDGDGDLEQLRGRAVSATRRLLKRQLTWLRSHQPLQEAEQWPMVEVQVLAERLRARLNSTERAPIVALR